MKKALRISEYVLAGGLVLFYVLILIFWRGDMTESYQAYYVDRTRPFFIEDMSIYGPGRWNDYLPEGDYYNIGTGWDVENFSEAGLWMIGSESTVYYYVPAEILSEQTSFVLRLKMDADYAYGKQVLVNGTPVGEMTLLSPEGEPIIDYHVPGSLVPVSEGYVEIMAEALSEGLNCFTIAADVEVPSLMETHPEFGIDRAWTCRVSAAGLFLGDAQSPEKPR